MVTIPIIHTYTCMYMSIIVWNAHVVRYFKERVLLSAGMTEWQSLAEHSSINWSCMSRAPWRWHKQLARWTVHLYPQWHDSGNLHRMFLNVSSEETPYNFCLPMWNNQNITHPPHWDLNKWTECWRWPEQSAAPGLSYLSGILPSTYIKKRYR